MQSGCRWVYTLMDWETGEVVAKGTSVELVEQGYFPDVNKLSSVWNNLEKCKNPSPKNYRWKMERKSTKDDRVERARAEGLSALMAGAAPDLAWLISMSQRFLSVLRP